MFHWIWKKSVYETNQPNFFMIFFFFILKSKRKSENFSSSVCYIKNKSDIKRRIVERRKLHYPHNISFLIFFVCVSISTLKKFLSLWFIELKEPSAQCCYSSEWQCLLKNLWKLQKKPEKGEEKKIPSRKRSEIVHTENNKTFCVCEERSLETLLFAVGPRYKTYKKKPKA